MSIHPFKQPFLHPRYCPSAKDRMARKHYRPAPRHEIKYLFGGIIGTPEEAKLARMMNGIVKQGA